MAIQIPFPLPSTGFALNSKLRINLDFIVSKFNEFNSGTATWDNVSVGSANSLTGTLTFYNSSNANYLTMQAGATDVSVTYTLPVIRPAGIASGTVYLSCDTVTNVMAWSAGGAFAPSSPDYVTMSLTAGLANERKLTAGTAISLVDGGANGNATINNTGVVSVAGTSNQVTVSGSTGAVTFSLPQSIGTSSDVQFNTLKVGAGDATNNAIQINDANTGFYQGAAGVGNVNLELDGTIAVIWTKSDLMLWNSGPVKASGIIFRNGSGANPTVTVNPPSGFTSYTLTLPVDDGTPNQVLTTDGSGVLSWTTASSGATTALDNLASVAVNLGLTPGVDNSIDLGTSSKAWKDIYLKGNIKSGSTSLLTLSTAGVGVLGTNTNNSASAGFVGEYVESLNSSNTNTAATNVWDDLVSLTLTAGDWDITACLVYDSGGATWNVCNIGVSSTSGNSATGLTQGINFFTDQFALSSVTPLVKSLWVPDYRVSLSTTTTYYLKRKATFSVGQPITVGGRLSARRRR